MEQLITAIRGGNIGEIALIRRQIRNLQNTYNDDRREQYGLAPERLELPEAIRRRFFAASLGQIASENAELLNDALALDPGSSDKDQAAYRVRMRYILSRLGLNKQLSDAYREALGLPPQRGIELTNDRRANFQATQQSLYQRQQQLMAELEAINSDRPMTSGDRQAYQAAIRNVRARLAVVSNQIGLITSQLGEAQ